MKSLSDIYIQLFIILFILPFSIYSNKHKDDLQSTTFTVQTGDSEIKLKTDRPVLLVSSTSWTGRWS